MRTTAPPHTSLWGRGRWAGAGTRPPGRRERPLSRSRRAPQTPPVSPPERAVIRVLVLFPIVYVEFSFCFRYHLCCVLFAFPFPSMFWFKDLRLVLSVWFCFRSVPLKVHSCIHALRLALFLHLNLISFNLNSLSGNTPSRNIRASRESIVTRNYKDTPYHETEIVSPHSILRSLGKFEI